MAIYDILYKKKRVKNAEILETWVSADTIESAKLIAKSKIGEEYTILKVKKS